MKYAPYSYSKVSLHNQCNRKFKYKYIDKIKVPFVMHEALIKGGAVHNILEHYPEPGTHKATTDYQYIADRFLSTKTAKEIYKHNSSREVSFGLDKQLNPCDYWDKEALYRGYIDHVYKDNDDVILIDFKTGKYKEEKWQSYDQLMSYGIYFFQKYPKLEKVKIQYVYVEHEDHINEVTLERKYLTSYITQLINLIKAAEEDNQFSKNQTQLCNWCDYQEHCNKDI